jgi:pyruvate/2-oxoglutarate dehydrogenase complex dihydrolipoamide acyltransferase (E2) component
MIYILAVPGPIEDVEEVRVLDVELETHKALVEVRAGQSGVLRRIACPEGAWQDLGKTLALFSDDPEEPMPTSTNGLGPLAVDFEVS